MKKNRQFFILKFDSDKLKDFKYKIITSFNEAKINNEVIAVADNQLLRTVRRIRNKDIDSDYIEQLYEEKEKLHRNKKSLSKDIRKAQFDINKALYIPDIISVNIKHSAHYNYLMINGFSIFDSFNKDKAPRLFKRISCSAGQARNSTVIFCNVEIIDEVKKILDNNRDLTKPIAPSKLNAYFGLYTTATKLVTEPKFIVVPDYINKVTFKSNFITETDWHLDDEIDVRGVALEINRTDGMGLISPNLASQWSNYLGLDYDCHSFIVRQSFIKGLVVTFDFHNFCKEVNNENYLIETIYKDEYGNPIMADLREYNMILSESQFKLWDSYPNIETYVENCNKNYLYWGVSQYEPKEYSATTNLNYQFIQALDLNKNKIEKLCEDFIEYVNSVSFRNGYKALLFLLGINHTHKSIENYLRSSNEYWIKALILKPELIGDKFIKQKIQYYIKKRINDGCLGEICVDGNFQFIISDPYAYMQHICGMKITGLLDKNHCYANYWNERNTNKIIAMRSPLTHKSECITLNLLKNNETEKWYQYCKNGIIVNWFNNENVRWAGSDYDKFCHETI